MFSQSYRLKNLKPKNYFIQKKKYLYFIAKGYFLKNPSYNLLFNSYKNELYKATKQE